jgi:hypothetical protein
MPDGDIDLPEAEPKSALERRNTRNQRKAPGAKPNFEGKIDGAARRPIRSHPPCQLVRKPWGKVSSHIEYRSITWNQLEFYNRVVALGEHTTSRGEKS